MWWTGKVFRAPHGGRLHIPREGMVAWCGYLVRAEPITIPADTEYPLCGTCLGRAKGLLDDEVIYSPRPINRWCDGSLNQDAFTAGATWRHGTCNICGTATRLTQRGSVYDPWFVQERHERPGAMEESRKAWFAEMGMA